MSGSPEPFSSSDLVHVFRITRRQAEVLALVATGRSNAEVADALSIRIATVVKHLEHLYPKLGVASRGSATVAAWSAVATHSTHVAPRALAERFDLSPRQSEVLACITIGLTDAEVANKLAIAPRTVTKHLEHIYRRLGARNRAGAIAAARSARTDRPP